MFSRNPLFLGQVPIAGLSQVLPSDRAACPEGTRVRLTRGGTQCVDMLTGHVVSPTTGIELGPPGQLPPPTAPQILPPAEFPGPLRDEEIPTERPSVETPGVRLTRGPAVTAEVLAPHEAVEAGGVQLAPAEGGPTGLAPSQVECPPDQILETATGRCLPSIPSVYGAPGQAGLISAGLTLGPGAIQAPVLGRRYRVVNLGGQADDVAWFEANRIQIARQYAGQWLVVKDQAVVAAYPDFQSAYNAGVAMFGTAPFLVKRAVERETPIREGAPT